jgi:hypothetical protein
MARICARPNCSNVVSQFKALGEVSLYLESAPTNDMDGLMVQADGLICGSCSVDLAEWWNRGKK